MEVRADEIKVSERARADLGDLQELKNSISTYGLFHPVVVDDGMNLLAGGRRFAALKELGLPIPIRKLGELNDLERLEVELEENIRRKDLTWQEEIALKQKIDEVKRALHGSKTSGQRTDLHDKGGKWGVQETAKELHETAGNVSRDLQLARAMKILPELHAEEGKVMAFRKMKRLESMIVRELLSRQTLRLPADELPFRILVGDAKEQISKLETESVQCVITSPPYWNQRDYGVAGQIGLESDPDLYVVQLANVFDELLSRVLRKDGTVWVNIDDTYADENKGGSPDGFVYDTAYGESVKMASQKLVLPTGVKKKDLVGIPWMFAFEMRQRGWWLRSCVVWYKSSSTPEGTTDRPVNVHEYIFMFSKSDVYEFNNQDWLQADPMKRKIRSVWPVDLTPTGDSGHIAAYPLELPRTCLLCSSQEGDLVLDPFCGSGTTGEAALREERIFVGIDLNEAYAKDTEQRLRAVYAGQVAAEAAEEGEGEEEGDSVVVPSMDL